MKKILVFNLSLLAFQLIAQTPESVQELSDRVEVIEKTFERLEILGITVGSLTILGLIGMAWVYFFKIKSKAESEVKNALQNELPAAVKKGIDEHPIGSLFSEELKARARSILIISKSGKDQKFIDFLSKNGFSNIDSYKLDELNGVNSNDYVLALFDNRKDRLMEQSEMDVVIEKFHTGFKYFYYNDSNVRFDSTSKIAKEVGMAGFANSEATISKQLAMALA